MAMSARSIMRESSSFRPMIPLGIPIGKTPCLREGCGFGKMGGRAFFAWGGEMAGGILSMIARFLSKSDGEPRQRSFCVSDWEDASDMWRGARGPGAESLGGRMAGYSKRILAGESPGDYLSVSEGGGGDTLAGVEARVCARMMSDGLGVDGPDGNIPFSAWVWFHMRGATATPNEGWDSECQEAMAVVLSADARERPDLLSWWEKNGGMREFSAMAQTALLDAEVGAGAGRPSMGSSL